MVPGIDLDRLGRKYYLFGLLFGVRSDTEQPGIAERRGLPPGMASAELSAQADYVNPQEFPIYHSHSWITGDELATVDWGRIYANHLQSRIDAAWTDLLARIVQLSRARGQPNVRLIVWFDS